MKNKNNVYKIVMLIIITAFITCMLTAIGMYKYMTNSDTLAKYITSNTTSTTDLNSLEQTLTNFKAILQEKYIGDLDEDSMIEGAIKGFVEGLGDPYTEYLTKDEMTTLTQETEGEYAGVGLYITNNTQTNEIVVLRTFGNSPANKAGILPGDVIKFVDNVEYTGEQLTEASYKMKGEVGTEVKITINRNGEELQFTIKRETIKLICNTSEMLDNNIGYIKISSFDGGCADEFIEQYNQLVAQGIKGIIIDLRNNGGGLVDESLKIADLAVDKGTTLLITKDKSEKEEITTAPNDKTINVPIVVLVNEYSASASEILTGILQEKANATVIGTVTFGKGVIQRVYSLSDGSGLKITTEEYYTPNHNKIHGIGITPNIEVQLPEEYINSANVEKQYDTQLQKALETLK